MNTRKFQHQHNSDIFTSDSEAGSCNISRGTQHNEIVLDGPTVAGARMTERKAEEAPVRVN